ncbi:hypothetical protein BGU76_00265, partial [Clostridioides difficile]
SEYSFVISIPAIIKTIVYFGIIFLLVMIFNIYLISKYKMIDLLIVERKTEDIKFKNPFVYMITFVSCFIFLFTVYNTTNHIIINLIDDKQLNSKSKGVEINEFTYQDWQQFCDIKYYGKKGLISMTLKEYIEKYK